MPAAHERFRAHRRRHLKTFTKQGVKLPAGDFRSQSKSGLGRSASSEGVVKLSERSNSPRKQPSVEATPAGVLFAARLRKTRQSISSLLGFFRDKLTRVGRQF
jgi:hypothetical protein